MLAGQHTVARIVLLQPNLVVIFVKPKTPFYANRNYFCIGVIETDFPSISWMCGVEHLIKCLNVNNKRQCITNNHVRVYTILLVVVYITYSTQGVIQYHKVIPPMIGWCIDL